VGKLPRVYAHYEDLEEYKAGMWKRISGDEARGELLTRAVEHLRDSLAFRAAMRRALAEWPLSCLVAFTTPSLNKANWLAHAGACLVRGVPEEFMRLGYWQLSVEERERADRDAAEIAAEWRDQREVR
jgi:hypothetical protein